MSTRDQASVATAARALRVLSAFQREGDELGVGEIARRLGIHKSSASRLAGTLLAHGFLSRAPGGERFRLGAEVARLGLLAVGGRALVDAARPALDALAAATGEAAVLSVPAGADALDVAQAGSGHLVGASTWIGRRSPLHACSDGKVLLAFGAPGAGDLPGGEGPDRLAALTPRTIADRWALDRELAGVRARGWATAVGELEEGLNGVAAPVVDGAGGCVAAVSVSGPAYRVPPERLAALAELCVEAARAVGARLEPHADASPLGGGGVAVVGGVAVGEGSP